MPRESNPEQCNRSVYVDPPSAEFTRIALMKDSAGENVRRFTIRVDHFNDLSAGMIGKFLPIAQRRGDGG